MPQTAISLRPEAWRVYRPNSVAAGLIPGDFGFSYHPAFDPKIDACAEIYRSDTENKISSVTSVAADHLVAGELTGEIWNQGMRYLL